MDKSARKRIGILGLAGFGTNVGWGFNKIFTAVLLEARGAAVPLIGAVLGIQGLFGIILNPVAGFVSDRLETRFGRRRPFLFIAFPGAALALMLLYFAQSLTIALSATIAFYFFQQLSQAPYQAMMPDVCEENDYGEASGILNVLWMLGTLVSFLVVPLVWQFIGHFAAFLIGSVVLLTTGLTTAIRSHEKPRIADFRLHPDVRLLASWEFLKYLVAQVLWWLGFEAIGSFFTPYMLHVLHGTLIDSALSMSIFSVTAVVVSLWFGRLYQRYDARVLLGAVLGLFVIVSLSGLMVHTVLQAFVMLAFAGVAWGGIQVVSYPLAVDTLREDLMHRTGLSSDKAAAATSELHGSVYGAVNLVQAGGLMTAAPVVGEVIARSGGHYQSMFVVSAVSLLFSLGLVAKMRRISSPLVKPSHSV